MSEIFTSEYLRKRGHCCNSNCLHCPYGTTAKNLGFQTEEITEENLSKAQEIIDLSFKSSDTIASGLLAGAFGNKPKKIIITSSNLNKFKLLHLKGHLCGVVEMGLFQVKNVYPAENFDNQGLDVELVTAYAPQLTL